MTVAEMLVKINADVGGLQRGMAQARGEISSLNKAGASTAKVGASMTKWVTLPTLAAGAAAVKLAADYQQTFTQIQALTGASQKQVSAWQQEILDFSRTMPQSPEELAQGLYFVASSGAKASDAMSILKASAKGAAAGLGDTQTVAEVVTSAVNAYGSANLSAARAVDIITQAIKSGKAEPAEFAGSLGRLIPVSQSLGVSFDQAVASVSALSNTGLDAAEGVTAVRGILTSLM